jgi:hypothetical protein
MIMVTMISFDQSTVFRVANVTISNLIGYLERHRYIDEKKLTEFRQYSSNQRISCSHPCFETSNLRVLTFSILSADKPAVAPATDR